MIVVDSVGWLAYFTGDPLAAAYRAYLHALDDLLTPSIIIYEVTKKIELQIDRQAAGLAAAQLLKTRMIPLDEALATAAARTSIAYKLPMADAIIYTTAQVHHARLITSDVHLKDLPGVEFIPHPNVATGSK